VRALTVLAPLVTIGVGVLKGVLAVQAHRRPTPARQARSRTAGRLLIVLVTLLALGLVVFALGNFTLSS